MNTHDPEILGRLVRIETRIAKLMTFFGLNPSTGEPLPPNKQRTNDAHRQPLAQNRGQQGTDRR